MDIKDFISAAVDEKPVEASKIFSDMMDSKVASALDSMHIDMLKSTFNNISTEVDEPVETEEPVLDNSQEESEDV